MNDKKLKIKNFLKTHCRKLILLAVNIVAYILLMVWAMEVYRLEGGHGYEVMGQIVPFTMIYIVFAIFSLIVYYLSIIASSLNRMYKERKAHERKD